jgi:hypothetical protein
LSQLGHVEISKSGEICAGFIFNHLSIFDLKTFKQILTIFSTTTEKITSFCFLNDEKICIFTENLLLPSNEKTIVSRKIVNVQNGTVLNVFDFVLEDYFSSDWTQTKNEKFIISPEFIWNLETNESKNLNFQQETVVSDQNYDEFNTEIVYDTEYVMLISLDNFVLEKFLLPEIFSMVNVIRKSMYHFWLFLDDKLMECSFKDQKLPLRTFQLPEKYSKGGIYKDYLIFGQLSVSLYKLGECGVLEKLETISNKFEFWRLSETGKLLIQYKRGVLVMKFKNDLSLKSLKNSNQLVDLNFRHE